MEKEVTVIEGDSVILACPLYKSAVPVKIVWLYAISHEYVTIDKTKAVSDNGTPLLQTFITTNCVLCLVHTANRDKTKYCLVLSVTKV